MLGKTVVKKKVIPSIILKKVIHIYRRGSLDVPALQGLTCTFYPGEIAVIMGPSGCGKTTLLNLISGLLTPNSGQILLQTKPNYPHLDIGTLEPEDLEDFRCQKIAYIFQTKNLISYLTCYENAIFPALVAENEKGEKIPSEEEIEDILNELGLSDRKDHYPSELSGGEQQRTCFAAALIKGADYIICDEPTGELDSSSKYQVFDLLRAMIEKDPQKTILIVTHDHEFKAIADRLYTIRDGKIVHETSQEELLSYRKKYEETRNTTNKGMEGNQLRDLDPGISELEELRFLIDKKIQEKKNKSK